MTAWAKSLLASPVLLEAFNLIFAAEVLRKLRDARTDVYSCTASVVHYDRFLKLTGNDAVWGADARKARRDLAKAKQELAFWKKAAAELKKAKP